MMKLRLHGVRGSRPTHSKDLLKHGGHSTCFEIIQDGDFHLFVDGGSGLVPRGHGLAKDCDKRRFHFLITHTHWDHILGLPFFAPFYSADNDITFHASNTSRAEFTELFFGLQRRGNLPVPRAMLKAKMHFNTVRPGDSFLVGDEIRVRAHQLNHQGITLGYRLEHGASSLCIVTDHAPLDGGNLLGEGMQQSAAVDQTFAQRYHKAFIDFLAGAHTVVFDTHFDEASFKADWGHCTPARAVAYCAEAGVKRLVLFHHAPSDTDADVERKVLDVTAAAAQAKIEVVAAKEGDEWTLCA